MNRVSLSNTLYSMEQLIMKTLNMKSVNSIVDRIAGRLDPLFNIEFTKNLIYSTVKLEIVSYFESDEVVHSDNGFSIIEDRAFKRIILDNANSSSVLKYINTLNVTPDMVCEIKQIQDELNSEENTWDDTYVVPRMLRLDEIESVAYEPRPEVYNHKDYICMPASSLSVIRTIPADVGLLLVGCRLIPFDVINIFESYITKYNNITGIYNTSDRTDACYACIASQSYYDQYAPDVPMLIIVPGQAVGESVVSVTDVEHEYHHKYKEMSEIGIVFQPINQLLKILGDK